jgi:hypothetical protein
MEPPTRIKLYGLISVTRRGYITQLVLAGILLAALLGMWLYLRAKISPAVSPEVARIREVFDYIPWVALGIAVLYAIEAVIVLRRFAREEAARRRAQPPQTPPKTP